MELAGSKMMLYKLESQTLKNQSEQLKNQSEQLKKDLRLEVPQRFHLFVEAFETRKWPPEWTATNCYAGRQLNSKTLLVDSS